ncbi:polyketide synthase dehydratase domain-containing protein, partial [Amycolatopsis minnesotensis]|uniref:polyketide synthase dehydratase domain-containing protein n=1 Tax=Amycolatopsis minnesotensis TaxID=337894 RepID=UPI0031DBBB49
ENLRHEVLFDPVVRDLLERDFDAFVEISPHPVLTYGLEETVEDTGADAVVLSTLRRDSGSLTDFFTALATAQVHGVDLDGDALYPGAPDRHYALPTYPFQHRHYWPRRSGAAAGNAELAGLRTTAHPLVSTVVELPNSDSVLLSGRVSLEECPWLADHAVLGTVLLPGTAFVELAATAAGHTGCDRVDELTLAVPLILQQGVAMRVQVVVEAPDADGARPVKVFSLAEDAAEGEPWTLHASGLVSASGTAPVAGTAFEQWPPSGAGEIDVPALYQRISAIGVDYGPAFRGTERAWRRGDEFFAEIALPVEDAAGASLFRLHPALFDAGMHPLVAPEGTGGDGAAALPFTWAGVRLPSAGRAAARVHAVASPGFITLTIADADGTVLAEVERLVSRPVAVDQLSAGRRAAAVSPLTVDWLPLDQEAPAEAVPFRVETVGRTDSARDAVASVLASIQDWLATDGEADSAERFVVVTGNAQAVNSGESPDPAAAAVWGLVRSAQTEHPDRFVLLDVDAELSDVDDVVSAAVAAGEPQVAVRGGVVLVPRVVVDESAVVEPAGFGCDG